MSIGTSKPDFAHLNHQQSPARKLPRDTLVVSSSWGCFHVSFFHSSRFFQTKVYSTNAGVLCHASSLCSAHFSSQGIAKPQYVATWVGVPKESQLHPRIIVPVFFFFFLGGWILGCCSPALALNTAFGSLRLMMWSNLWLNSGAKGRGQKENFINHPPNPLAIALFFYYYDFFTSQSLRSLATPSGRLKISRIFSSAEKKCVLRDISFPNPCRI